MKIGQFKVSEKKQNSGVWFDAGEGLRVLVSYAENQKYLEAIREGARPHIREIRRETISRQKQREITCRAQSKHILLGWENLQDENGADIPYSSAKAYELLLQFPEFEKMVMEFASDLAAFRDDMTEESSGN